MLEANNAQDGLFGRETRAVCYAAVNAITA